MCEKLPSLALEEKVCDDCRKKLAQMPTPSVESTESYGSSQEDASANTQYAESAYQQQSLESLSQCLTSIGETPINKKKLQQVHYPKEKMKKIEASVKKTMPQSKSSNCDDEGEMIAQLKKFHTTTKRSEKAQVLTVLSKSWSIKKV